ncbi:RNA polymerase sigma factor [Riemerella columbipharyngis]|uniref:RNA polymerase sigma-70 factor, ECF subfamily n=1 Tax=Riemerella columbipharyngis TaxID=1071918 RepID=A0A1G7DWX3_9FLAO|nr:sigma-70 family RNA polymerase sigma factor [Riemerella columbipharyngis]SDE55959.1 RNA polymerase sigma-70 factor, ECF subfamily [Riemerella columbipharyngis]
METLLDEVLIREYQEGNESALSKLISKYHKDIQAFIFYKVMDKTLADDFFQDTLLKVITKLKSGQYRDEGKFLVWVKRIAYNLIVDYYRVNSKIRKISEISGGYSDDEFTIFDFLYESSENIEEYLVSMQIQEDLNKMIYELPEIQKEVIKLRFYDGLSFKEIAEHTGASINTTLGRVRYAIFNLRKIMNENQIVLTR